MHIPVLYKYNKVLAEEIGKPIRQFPRLVTFLTYNKHILRLTPPRMLTVCRQSKA